MAIASLLGGLTLTPRPYFSQKTDPASTASRPSLLGQQLEAQPSPTAHLQSPIQLTQTPPSNASQLGQELIQQLTECVQKKLSNNPQQPSLDRIQALAMQCTLRVVMLTPDGKVRPDANKRMTALIQATGIALPKSSSQGQASVTLKPLPNSRVFTVPVTIGGQSKTFLLDTGASNSILDQQIVQQLKLEGTPIPNDLLAYFVVGSDCSQVNATLHSLPPLTVQSAQVEGLNGMGLPKTAIPGNSSGVLGLDFLKGFDLVVNPKSLKLQLLPPSRPIAGAIPLVGKLGVMTTQVKINGQGPFSFLLDTGADTMVLSERLASRLSLNSTTAKKVEVRGFCGNESGKQTQLKRVSLQQHEVAQLDAVILENRVLDLLGVEGIVGQNFLTQYQQHWQFGPPNELGFPEKGSLELTPLTQIPSSH